MPRRRAEARFLHGMNFISRENEISKARAAVSAHCLILFFSFPGTSGHEKSKGWWALGIAGV